MSEVLNLEEGIYYPNAIRLPGVVLRVRGTYANRFPIGAIVHSTDGRPGDGEQATRNAATEGLYAYFVIGRTGNVYQSFSLEKWGKHAGWTFHPRLGSDLSTKLVGIEIVSAGKLRKLENGSYRPWYNEAKYLREFNRQPDPRDDFGDNDVRFRDAVGSRREFG